MNRNSLARLRPTPLFAPACAALLAAALTGLHASDADPRAIFLGTGAADSLRPNTHTCANCTYVREHGGRNARRFASLFVSPDVMIDGSTTGRDGLKAAGVAPAAVAHLLITHSHGDHFNPAAIAELAKEKGGQIVLSGNARVVAEMKKHLEATGEKTGLVLREIKPGQEFDAGEWRCKALPASHAPGEDPLLYLMRRKGKTLLYATDTAWFPAATFAALKSEKLDLAIVEGTFAEQDNPDLLTAHMNLPFDRLVKRFLIEQKVLKPEGTFALTHMSLHWCEPHDTLQPKLATEGILLPHDGLKLAF